MPPLQPPQLAPSLTACASAGCISAAFLTALAGPPGLQRVGAGARPGAAAGARGAVARRGRGVVGQPALHGAHRLPAGMLLRCQQGVGPAVAPTCASAAAHLPSPPCLPNCRCPSRPLTAASPSPTATTPGTAMAATTTPCPWRSRRLRRHPPAPSPPCRCGQGGAVLLAVPAEPLAGGLRRLLCGEGFTVNTPFDHPLCRWWTMPAASCTSVSCRAARAATAPAARPGACRGQPHVALRGRRHSS